MATAMEVAVEKKTIEHNKVDTEAATRYQIW